MGQILYILLGWLMTVAGAYALGRILWFRLGVRFTRDEEITFSFLLGAAAYSQVIFFLGIFHLYHRGVFIGLPLTLVLAAWRLGALTLSVDRFPALPRWLRLSAGSICGLFGLLYLSNAMAPEISSDGSTYHLGLVARYYRERGMVPVHTSFYSALSQGVEMLFLSAFALGRHSAAAMVHCTFLFLLPWMMVNWARRRGMPISGVAGAMLVFLAPVAGVDGISAYNDVAAAAVVFGVFSLLDRWDQTREANLLLAVGALAGFSYAVKYTLALSLPFAVGWVLWRERKLRPVLVVLACAAAFIVPWMVRNAIWWNNPVAPLFNAWFPNPYVHQWFEKEYKAGMARYGLASLWTIPFEVTFGGGNLAGRLGPVFLLAPLALLSLRNPMGRRLLLAWLVFTSTYFTNIGTRFLLPGLPFLALALAMLPWTRLVLATVAVHAALSWPDSIKFYGHKYGWRLDKIVWREAMRIESEEAYLSAFVPTYPIVRLIDAQVPAGRRVYSFQQLAEAYCRPEIVVAFQSAQGEILAHSIHNALREDRKPTVQVRYTFPPRPLAQARVLVTRDWPDARWSIHEMRLFHQGAEIPRSPHWRVHADSAGEQAPLAFDNSLATRWHADVPWRKGDGVAVDLGSPLLVDEVVLEMSPDQPWDGILLEGIPEAKVERRVVAPPLGLRRAALEELLARDVHYIAAEAGEYWFADLQNRSDSWGIEEIGTRGSMRLYRILANHELKRIMK